VPLFVFCFFNEQIFTDGLLQKATILNTQIHNTLSEIQEKLMAMGAADDGAPQEMPATVNVDNEQEILRWWMERLPLMEVQAFLDFNEMLLEHPSVGNEIVKNLICRSTEYN
jgi:hypothetical protein